jgi:hypothetical protein
MKSFERFLFFYSIVAITALFISFGIFSPKPLNLISLVLIIPVIFYFWVRLTSPEATSAEKWSVRFVTVIVILSGLGVFAYRLEQTITHKPEVIISQVIPTPISTPTATKSATTHGEGFLDLLTDTPSPIPLQQFKGKTGAKLIDVYASPFITSRKITTLDGTQTYLYLLKRGDWYEIALSGSEMGWVSGSQIQEVQ